MGLFDNTVQTLSNMAINESGFEVPQVAAPAIVDEFKAMLDMMPVLNEEEMMFPVYAVPVKESKRLGRYLIEMEDISRYMLTNGISNLLEAIQYIGNNNGIRLDESNTALVIDEASVLQEMDELGMNIGGSNSNEGNIGTVGLLGPHTDIGKFRRFANSREFVDTVANKYGLPIVKKNYTIGLIKADDGEIRHNGNLQEADVNAAVEIDDPTKVALHENEPKKKDKSLTEDGVEDAQYYDYSQYIKDIATGKFDTELMAEAYGGDIIDYETAAKKTLNETSAYEGQVGGMSLLDRIRNSSEYKNANTPKASPVEPKSDWSVKHAIMPNGRTDNIMYNNRTKTGMTMSPADKYNGGIAPGTKVVAKTPPSVPVSNPPSAMASQSNKIAGTGMGKSSSIPKPSSTFSGMGKK